MKVRRFKERGGMKVRGLKEKSGMKVRGFNERGLDESERVLRKGWG